MEDPAEQAAQFLVRRRRRTPRRRGRDPRRARRRTPPCGPGPRGGCGCRPAPWRNWFCRSSCSASCSARCSFSSAAWLRSCMRNSLRWASMASTTSSSSSPHCVRVTGSCFAILSRASLAELVQPHVQRQQDVVLGLEVVVERRLGDVEAFGDLPQAGAVEALLGEEVESHIEDALAGVGFRGGAGGGGLALWSPSSSPGSSGMAGLVGRGGPICVEGLDPGSGLRRCCR